VNLHHRKRFYKKYGPDARSDVAIENEIIKRAKNSQLPCAVAFEIVKNLGVSADQVGMNVDFLNIRLTKCQLGLFGYEPDKKIVKPQNEIKPDLKDAILNTLTDEKLSCKNAWEIASRLNVGKMTVSGTCETLKLKIKPCQLGAF